MKVRYLCLNRRPLDSGFEQLNSSHSDANFRKARDYLIPVPSCNPYFKSESRQLKSSSSRSDT